MKTKVITIGRAKIGGGNPVLVQSMTNTLTRDATATVKQIRELEEAGCEIIRVALPDMESVEALKEIRKRTDVPIVGDIHFDHRIAVEAAPYLDKLRINPGNIGSEEKIRKVVEAAKHNSLPMRIGVNLGSLEKDIEAKYGLTAEAMVESAFRHIKMLEENDFEDIVVSLKASDVPTTVKAYELFSEQSHYPLHVGITEAGTLSTGTIKSAAGIGILLNKGIGDTIRVSLSADPVEEVRAGWQILKALKLRARGVEVSACPTCARANYDVSKIAKEIEEKTASVKKGIRIAVMGCGVNGPGEAKEADIGVVGGSDGHLLYKDGDILKKIKEHEIAEEVIRLI